MGCCKDTVRLSSKRLDQPLTWAERLRVWKHTWRCPACRVYLEQVRSLHRALLHSRSRRSDDALPQLSEGRRTQISILLSSESDR
jgi:predicted anti-sigma-YlaC factor YlaD